MMINFEIITCYVFAVLVTIQCQEEIAIPLSRDSFRGAIRSFEPVPKGRSTDLSDTRIIFFQNNIKNYTSYRFRDIASLLKQPTFDLRKPTVLYIHGYVEIFTDISVSTVVRAYIQRGDHNILVLDWANRAFGNYLTVVLNVQPVGEVTAKAITTLLKNGLSIDSLHLVGHSTGSHIAPVISRVLKEKGFTVPRITGLDPAFPGFYPPIYTPPISAKDATFVDIIHTDGGKFGAPVSTGHVDFWPNSGTANQPGCRPLTVVFSIENLCSHWRSWHFWAESVAGGDFVARKCEDYDAFLRGKCGESESVLMGLLTNPELRGNYYLRTATKTPFALGERGAI